MRPVPDLTVRGRRRPDAACAEHRAAYDLVVGDAFGGLAVPWHLTTREIAAQVRAGAAPGRRVRQNVIDYPPDRFTRAEIATLRLGLPDVA